MQESVKNTLLLYGITDYESIVDQAQAESAFSIDEFVAKLALLKRNAELRTENEVRLLPSSIEVNWDIVCSHMRQ